MESYINNFTYNLSFIHRYLNSNLLYAIIKTQSKYFLVEIIL